MPLLLYRANRIEALSAAAAQLLKTPPFDPTSPEAVLHPETIVVHSMGMQRWLSMELASELGIAANVNYPFPTRTVHDLMSVVNPSDTPGEADAWLPHRLVWSVLAEVQEAQNLPGFEPLRRYLESTEPLAEGITRSHYQLARKIADTFDKYITYRPEMILSWQESPAQDNDSWQPILWRRLRAAIGTRHPVEIARDALLALRPGEPTPEGLPPRLLLFGLSTIPPLYLEVFSALSNHLPVHLFALCPSRFYWGHIQSRREIAARLRREATDAVDADDLFLDEGNPLLGSLGRVGRDFQCILEGQNNESPYIEAPGDLFVEPDVENPTLLTLMQRDILDLRYPGGTPGQLLDATFFPPPHVVPPTDRSIEMHACHGPLRQVEVLKERLLQRLQEDPELTPRDIVVLTPDIALYGPLIEAVFSEGATTPSGLAEHGFPRLPFSIADRGQASENPVAEALLGVLALPAGRVTGTEVLDLLNLPPIRQRFDISVEDLHEIRGWVNQAGIRWGIDGAHREANGHPRSRTATWMFGMDRLFLGYVYGEDTLFGDAVSLSEDGISNPALLGRLGAFCRALFGQLESLHRPRAVVHWGATLRELLGDLTSPLPGEEWRTEEVLGGIEALVASGASRGEELSLDLNALIVALTEHLNATPGVNHFLRGGVTCCALLPMRSVPFSVVCLLGMDDNQFPRQVSSVGFDLTASHPRIGDRNHRDDDRYLLLESLLSARQALIITYTGRGVRDNKPCPPAVPIGELGDYLERAFHIDGTTEGTTRDHLTVTHPLQPFSPSCFLPEAAPFSFNRACFLGAQKLSGERFAPPLFLSEVPTPLPEELPLDPTVDLNDLLRFFSNPSAYLLREQFGVVHRDTTVEHSDATLLALDGLESWRLGDLLCRLGSRTSPPEKETLRRFLHGTGQLPAGTPGEIALRKLTTATAPLLAEFAPFREAPLQHRDVRVPLTDGTSLTGRVTPLRNNQVLQLQYSRLKGRHLLGFWLRHLALQASPGSTPTVSLCLSRSDKGVPTRFELAPLDPDSERNRSLSTEHLLDLARLHHQGRHLPLPFFPETSLAYARKVERDPEDPGNQAAGRKSAEPLWNTSRFNDGEGQEPATRQLFGDLPDPFSPDFAHPALPNEAPFRFEALATRVYLPLLKSLTHTKALP